MLDFFDFYRWHVSSFLRLICWQQCLTWSSLASQEQWNAIVEILVEWLVRRDNDCIFYHANNLGRLLLSSSTVLIAVRNNKFGINLLIDSPRSSLYKFNAPWPLLALVGLLAPDQKIDLKIIGTHLSILLGSKLHWIINLKRSIWQIIIIQISLQIFSIKFTETTWNLT